MLLYLKSAENTWCEYQILESSSIGMAHTMWQVPTPCGRCLQHGNFLPSFKSRVIFSHQVTRRTSFPQATSGLSPSPVPGEVCGLGRVSSTVSVCTGASRPLGGGAGSRCWQLLLVPQCGFCQPVAVEPWTTCAGEQFPRLARAWLPGFKQSLLLCKYERRFQRAPLAR